MIELRNVSKSFAAVHALHSFSLSITPGATTVLIGPSGSGKSTVLRLMIGLDWPEQGQVFFRGKELRPEELETVRRKIGYVIQEGGLFPHLTARGNVALMAHFLGWEEEKIEKRIAELAHLTRFPLEGLDRYPSQLSGGQRQRVSLMRALMLDPDLLLLDEPLGALDPMIRAELQWDLQRIFRALEKTVVLVTHDMGEAMFFGDHVVLLHEGRIIQQGSPEDLFRSPADPFVTRFINAQRTLAQEVGGSL
ncbi:ATP-binding cassette domain-containing protein [Geomonas sp. RF6]|uniref:ATP-binding cassette domain-containing protein n=1 Tax=Geomonas sp. RF6 TaxID=2897342 RepID=UPI001E47DE00|nr:ATP-binding cassette domain-containing protein [Geomonas sp. RF6]UFS69776.1 ATP-binding cassette domain-containing protein [Geomonas sp. RF6]